MVAGLEPLLCMLLGLWDGGFPGMALPHQSPLFNSIIVADLPQIAEPAFIIYNLGTIELNQQGVPDRVQTMPVPLAGGLAVPQGRGPFPVVVVLHGRHPGCHFAAAGTDSQWPCPAGTETRFDLGFAYLARVLAAEGYIVLTIDLNGAYSNTYGATEENRNDLADQRSPQIINAHLKQLAAANAGQPVGFGLDLTGKVDLSKIAVIGHSMGGGAAALSGIRRQGNRTPAQIAQGMGPFSGLLLLSPTRSQGMTQRPETYQLPDIPVSVLMGGCDRDIFDFSSAYYFETANQDQNRTALAAFTLIWGANHNFFSQAVIEDDYTRQPNNRFLCEPGFSSDRLSRSAQEQFLINYSRDFLSALFAPDGGHWSRLGLDVRHGAPQTLYGAKVTTNLFLNHRRRLLTNQRDHYHGNLDPQLARTWHYPQPLTIEFCPAFSSCHHRPSLWPEFPDVWQIRWMAAGESLIIPIRPDQADVSQFDAMQLRLATDPEDGRQDRQSTLAVVLRDHQGQARRVDLPPTLLALRLPPPDPDYGYTGFRVYPTAVRVPLAQFQGVNMQELAQVELWFDQATTGSIDLAELSFVMDPSKGQQASP